MASFRATASEPAPHLSDEDQVLSLQPPQHQENMLHKVWTVCSNKKIKTLNLNLPGVVFVDYDPKLGSSSSSLALPPTTSDPDPDFEARHDGEAQGQDVDGGRVVAKIVVTSDSVDLLESLELVPLDADQADEGFKFRVKNENVELKGSILTQVFVSDKNALQEFYGSAAEFVLGDAVLVQQDRTAVVKVSVFNSGSLYLSSTQEFSLLSFGAAIGGSGICQLQVPSIDLQEELSLVAFGSCTLAIAADIINAKEIKPTIFWKKSDIVVQTSSLKAKHLSSTLHLGGRIHFAGSGEVKKQVVMIGVHGTINTGDIVSEEAVVIAGWSGHAVVSALKKLNAFNPFFGTIEYTNMKPEDVIESSWLWWRTNKTPSKIVTPAATSAAESNTTTTHSYEFREPPLRQPMPIHHRVKSSKWDGPQLTKSDVPSWVSRYSKLGLLTGFVAVGAIVVIGSRRKTARLN